MFPIFFSLSFVIVSETSGESDNINITSDLFLSAEVGFCVAKDSYCVENPGEKRHYFGCQNKCVQISEAAAGPSWASLRSHEGSWRGESDALGGRGDASRVAKKRANTV